jgi:DNA invertase Pin-like site-specific DNA recombinase
MKFAFYGRLSDDELGNPEISIPYQKSECIKSISETYPDSEIVVDFVDEGFSGDELHRPDLQRMLYEALEEDRDFDHIIVFAIDRMSRGAGILDIVNRILAPTGVAIFEALDRSDPRNPGIAISRDFRAVSAGVDKKMMIIRSGAGMRLNLKELGYSNGGRVPYGYAELQIPRSNPKKKPHIRFVVDPESGPIVNRIFDMFVFQGHGQKSIASALNEDSIDPPEWYAWKKAGAQEPYPSRSGRNQPYAQSCATRYTPAD